MSYGSDDTAGTANSRFPVQSTGKAPKGKPGKPAKGKPGKPGKPKKK